MSGQTTVLQLCWSYVWIDQFYSYVELTGCLDRPVLQLCEQDVWIDQFYSYVELTGCLDRPQFYSYVELAGCLTSGLSVPVSTEVHHSSSSVSTQVVLSLFIFQDPLPTATLL